MAYQDKDGSFTGVCLDLDLVEEGHKNLKAAVSGINEAINSHIQAAQKLGFPEELITRPAPKAYWKKLAEFTKPQSQNKEAIRFEYFNIRSQDLPWSYA